MSAVMQMLAGAGRPSGAWLVGFTASQTYEFGTTFGGVRFNANGTVDKLQSFVAPSWANGFETWYTPTGGTPGNSYWIRATLDSGSTPTGTFGSWTQMSSTQTWSAAAFNPGTFDCVFTIEIASDSGGSTIVATAQYTIQLVSGT